MLHNCYEETQEPFFLQPKTGMHSPTPRNSVISPHSHTQKKSLRTLKSVRSQKSLKTIDSETVREYTPVTSLQFIEHPEINKLKRIPRQQHVAAQRNAENMENRGTVEGRARIEKKMTYPAVQSQRVSIRFGDPSNLRRFLSPQPTQVTEKIAHSQTPLTPEVTPSNFIMLEQEHSLKELKEETISITIQESAYQERGEQTKEKDWDMRSTHHVDNLKLPLPETAKSTISMISDRSQADSVVVMDHLPTSGKLTKLV